jgi:RHS repeat-associated protein
VKLANRGWLAEALTKAAGGTGSTVSDFKYDYDDNGNLTHRSDPAGASWTSYGTDNANQLCWSVAGKQTVGTHNRLTCATTPTGATTYTVDADGQETAQSGRGSIAWNKRHQASSVFSTSMGYVGPDNSLRLTDGTSSFKYNALGLGTKTVAGSSNYYTRDPGGQLLSDRTTAGTYNYVFDGLGSVAALTSSTGTVAKTYSYDPYGTVTAGAGSVDNPWQYASGFYDSGPNTVKFGQRYYDPSTARWTQTDPIDAVGIQQANRYLYVGGEPIDRTDPSGRVNGGDWFCLADWIGLRPGVLCVIRSWQCFRRLAFRVHLLSVALGITAIIALIATGERVTRRGLPPWVYIISYIAFLIVFATFAFR